MTLRILGLWLGLWVLACVGYIAALFVVVGPALHVAGNAVVARLLVAVLPTVGIEGVRRLDFRFVDVGSRRLVIDDIVVGEDRALEIGRLVVDYRVSPFELREVSVSDLRLAGAIGDGGPSFGSLDPVIEALIQEPQADRPTEQDGADAEEFRIPAVTIRRSRVELDTPFGLATVRLDAVATPRAPGAAGSPIGVEARYEATLVAEPTDRLGAGGARLAGTVSADIAADGGADIRATGETGLADFERFAFGGLDGDVVLSLPGSGSGGGGVVATPRGRLAVTVDVAEVDGTATGPVRARLGMDGVAIDGTIALGRDGDALSVTLAARDPLADPVVTTVTVRSMLASLAPLIGPLVSTDPVDGGGLVTVTMEVTAGRDALLRSGMAREDGASLLDALSAVGRLEAAGARIADLTLDGALDAVLGAGFLSLDANRPVTAGVGPTVAALLPEAVRGSIRRGATVILGRDDAPFSLTLAPGASLEAVSTGPVSLAIVRGPAIAADGSATLSLGGETGWAASLDDVSLRVSRLGMAPFSSIIARLNGAVSAAEVDLAYAVTAALAEGAVEQGGGMLRGRLDLSGRARTHDDRLDVGLSKGFLSLADGRLSGWRLVEPVAIGIAAGARRPLLSLSWPSLEDLEVSAVASEAVLPLIGPEGTSDRLTFGGLAAEGRLSLDGSAGRIELALAPMAYGGDALPIEVSGLAGEASLVLARGRLRVRRLSATVDRVSDLSTPARVVPISLALSGREREDRLDLEFSAMADGGQPRLTVRATADPADWSATGGFFLDPMTFAAVDAPGATGRDKPGSEGGNPMPLPGISAISPWLKRWIDGVDGAVSLLGTFRAGPGLSGIGGSAEVRFDGFSVDTRYGHLVGLTGAVALGRLAPPATAGPQTLSAEALIEPVPIQQPRIVIALEEDGLIRIDRIEGRFADGHLLARNIRFRPGEPLETVLEIDGLGAEALAELVDLDGLSASGTLSGRLPVTVDPTRGVSIRGGLLSADGDGAVRYAPASAPAGLEGSGEEVDLMLRAVKNFQYDTLALTVNGEPGKDYVIGMALGGSNPDLYDGYPLKFNLKVSGRLDDILQSALRTYGLPGRIDELLREKGLGG